MYVSMDNGENSPERKSISILQRTGSFLGIVIAVVMLIVFVVLSISLDVVDVHKSHEYQTYVFCGGLLSLLSSVSVILSCYMIPPWRRHPNPIILYRSIADFILSVLFVSLSFPAKHWRYEVDESNNCALPSFITQFSIMSAECWFMALSCDLIASITNPFTSFKANMKTYHYFSWGTGLLTAIILVGSGAYGLNDVAICWIRDQSGVWDSFYLWILFVAEMFIICPFSFFTYFFAKSRIQKGIPSTHESRRKILENASSSLGIFVSYWTLLLIFAVSYVLLKDDSDLSESKGSPFHKFLLFFLAAKGYVTAIVWYRLNPIQEFISRLIMKIPCLSSDSPEKKRSMSVYLEEQYEGLSPQLNLVLRTHVLCVTSLGIRLAAKLQQEEGGDGVTAQTDYGQNNDIFSREIVFGLRPAIEAETSYFRRSSGSLLSSATSKLIRMNSGSYPVRFVNLFESNRSESKLNTSRVSEIVQLFIIMFNSVFDFSISDQSNYQHLSHSVFVDYYPRVFVRLRQQHGISCDEYMSALQEVGKEMLSEGASGSFMFFSRNGAFIVKSISTTELRSLTSIIKSYADFLYDNPGSFLTKYYGCHSIRLFDRNFHFVVMGNVLNTNRVVNYRYDIKGSWVDRNADPVVAGNSVTCRHCNMKYVYGERKSRRLNSRASRDGSTSSSPQRSSTISDEFSNRESPLRLEDSKCTERSVGGHEPNIVLKDNDIAHKIKLELPCARSLLRQLEKDANFLCSHNIMDYSLLMGVSNHEFLVNLDSSKIVMSERNIMTKLLKQNSLLEKNSESAFNSTQVSSHTIAEDKKDFEDDIERNSHIKQGLETLNERISLQDAILKRDGKRKHTSMNPLVSGNSAVIGEDTVECDSQKMKDEYSVQVKYVIGPAYYYIGVVDILQTWTWQKVAERWLKILLLNKDGEGISAIEPNNYMMRFMLRLRDIIDQSEVSYESEDMTTTAPRLSLTPSSPSWRKSSYAVG